MTKIDSDIDFVELVVQPGEEGYPLMTIIPVVDWWARQREREPCFPECPDAGWFVEQFKTLAEAISCADGPSFTVPKHQIHPNRWRAIVCHATELLGELRSEGPDAGRVSRLTEIVVRVLRGVEVKDGLDAHDAQLQGRKAHEQHVAWARKHADDQKREHEKWRAAANRIRRARAEVGSRPLFKTELAPIVKKQLYPELEKLERDKAGRLSPAAREYLAEAGIHDWSVHTIRKRL